MEAIYAERNERYKENWREFGPVMDAIFPKGVTLRGPDDFIKFSLFEWALGKLIRFARTDFTHEDSILDAAVYLTILLMYLRERPQVKENVNASPS